MNKSSTSNSQPTPSHNMENTPAKPHRQKRNLAILTALLLIIGIITAFFYLTKWQYLVDTDDAYVNGNLVQITAQIPGTVQAVNVRDTDMVKTGESLILLDKANARLSLEKAKSDLASAVREYATQNAHIKQADSTIAEARSGIAEAKAQLSAARSRFAAAQSNYQRRRKLISSHAIAAEELNHARDSMLAAQAEVQAAQAGLDNAQAKLSSAQAQKQTSEIIAGQGEELRNQPAVQAAISELRNAWLNLQRTDIRAPISGQIARRNVQLGQQISPGVPLMVVVPLHQLWVDANFKESQLKDLRIGQRVQLTSDIYGDDVVFHGIIEGLSAGTGSAFSALPAQNATGNWIKVVQRVPVRISLNSKEIAAHPLRVGLTMHATVDIRDKTADKALLQTHYRQNRRAEVIPTPNMHGAEQVINDILKGR